MKCLVQSGVSTHIANFRNVCLIEYRLDRKSLFKSCRQAPSWRRERLGVECAHEAAISVLPALRSYRRTPTSESFAALYASVEDEFRGRMKGTFGGYVAKCFWDCYALRGGAPAALTSASHLLSRTSGSVMLLFSSRFGPLRLLVPVEML